MQRKIEPHPLLQGAYLFCGPSSGSNVAGTLPPAPGPPFLFLCAVPRAACTSEAGAASLIELSSISGHQVEVNDALPETKGQAEGSGQGNWPVG